MYRVLQINKEKGKYLNSKINKFYQKVNHV